MSLPPGQPPLVVHVVYRFDVGGLENGIVNLINHMPRGAYRHAVLALTDVSASFARRITGDDVPIQALHKPPGQGIWLYPQVQRLLRQWRPAIVHTRNLAALEMVVPAWAAGVPVRIHGEHGRDVEDLAGTRRRYQWLRRAYRPFVSHYVALSQDLARYMTGRVGVPPQRLSQIYNGVDTARFAPAAQAVAIPGCPFAAPQHWIVGSVGRMQTVKDPLTLARAFVQVLQMQPALRDRLRLVMVGDGALRAAARQVLDDAGVGALCWLPGERQDVADVMRGLQCFVLPSLAEGVSNTILEAMATGLPVLATDVGGNAELVAAGRTGALVPAADPTALALQLLALAEQPAQAARLGAAGRADVAARWSLHTMVGAYQGLYDRLLVRQRRGVARQVPR